MTGVAAAAVQGEHPLLADRTALAQLALDGLDDGPGPSRRGSRSASAHASAAVSRLMTWRRMPKRSTRPVLGGELAHPGDTRREQVGRLAPREVDVDVAGGDDLRRARRAAEVQRRRRLGDLVDGRALDVEVASVEVERRAATGRRAGR